MEEGFKIAYPPDCYDYFTFAEDMQLEILNKLLIPHLKTNLFNF